ncbi:MAG: glycosyltransferase family 39 protein [Vicinamibacterales bacterium]
MLVLLCVALFFAIGMNRIEFRGITHVEAYIPGMNLPPEISEPPPRFSLVETLTWHWHSEPHPPGYFILMLGWTKLFGASLLAVRLPSLLLGCASIVMAHIVGRRMTRTVWGGVIAAALLTFNGHHLLWALMARPYELALALSLLSTWLWLQLLSDEHPNPKLEIAYAITLALGLYTHVLLWTFLAAQMAYSILIRPPRARLASRVLYFQSLSTLVSSPMIFHALYSGRGVGSGGDPSFAFTQDFLNFGFLFNADPQKNVDIPFLFEGALTLCVLLCILLFIRDQGQRRPPQLASQKLPPLGSLILIGLGFSIILFCLNRQAWREVSAAAVTPIFPLLTLLGYAGLTVLRVPHTWPKQGFVAGLSPLPFLGAMTLLLTYAISVVQPAAVSRGLLIAVPPLLLTIAGGCIALLRIRRSAGVAVLIFAGSAGAYSLEWYRDYLIDRDYRGLAERLVPSLQEGDRLFVRNRDWLTTPFFYHLPDEHGRLIAKDYQKAIGRVQRVWVINFDRQTTTPEMSAALGEFSEGETLFASRARATLYFREDSER